MKINTKFIYFLVFTLLIESLLIYMLCKSIHIKYIEYSFFIGLALSFLIYWFHKGGGLWPLGRYIQAVTGIETDGMDPQSELGPVFFGSVLYVVISFFITMWHYRSYFF
jgi:hypothetical protein